MPELKVAFLNVGQGDSTVITLPDGITGIVVDCYKNGVKKYIDNNGIATIACVFLTHSDYDHAAQVANLLRNFPEATLFYSPDTLKLLEVSNQRRILLKQLTKFINERSLQVESPEAGDRWQFQKAVFEVLHPTTNDRFIALGRGKEGDTNTASTLLRVTFAGKRVLLTGDLAEMGWRAVVERRTDLKADVLKFPHHGSFYKTDGDHALDKLIEHIDPSLVILSVGTTNSYNHPHPEVIKLLNARPNLTFRCTQATRNCFPRLSTPDRETACSGDIEITISEAGLELTTARTPPVCRSFRSAPFSKL